MSVVVVNDASCLIDLRKGRLLEVLPCLDFWYVVPFPIRESELLDFTPAEWAVLERGGMATYDLSPEQLANASNLKQQFSFLSAKDCFCLVTAQHHADSILLTGDQPLRKIATELGVRSTACCGLSMN